MASNIPNFSENINVLYPVPGVDNDTQGFRDNFSNIKNALTSAAEEISALQGSSVKTTVESDFSYNGQLSRVVLKSTAQPVISRTSDFNNSPVEINYNNGSYQKIDFDQSTGTVDVFVINWPGLDNLCGNIRLELVNSNTTSTKTVSFNANGGTLKVEESSSSTVTLSTSSIKFVELWSPNKGSTVYLRSLGGNYR